MSGTASGLARETAGEQARVDERYARLDLLRSSTEARLRDVRAAGSSGTPAARMERDAFATLYEDRLAQLRAVEDRLVFGRLDLEGGDVRYVGRIGLSDETQEQLLTDWRAPAAEPFYRATAADPLGVVRRRHLTLTGRTVTALEDDVVADGAALPEGMVVAGGGALMAAVTAARTGRMRDVVATLQAEQDAVVRAPLPGVLVVQGGPGTGKTAVALHRAAYLLYAHRDRIAKSGVLVVGPNRAFLRYIDQVLPALGETGVVMASLGELFPGVRATAVDDDDVAALKGDVRMVELLAAAVRQRQRVPLRPVRLSVGTHAVVLRPRTVRAARDAARDSRQPHNVARASFVRRVLNDLVRQLASAQGTRGDDLDADTRQSLEAELRESPDVRREVNLCWMPLTPSGLLRDLWAKRDHLAGAAAEASRQAGHHGRGSAQGWRREELARLARPKDAPFTVADVPLLDELAELLGEDPSSGAVEAARAARERADLVAQARGVLQSGMVDPSGGGALTAEGLAERWAFDGPRGSVAERAEADRTWAYGHVVVDEAQELSAMVWRLLARRCPSRSMTVVGDLAQTSSAAGARDWGEALAPVLGTGTRTRSGVDLSRTFTLSRLTVNYRTPRQVMDLASRVLEAHGLPEEAPRSIRDAEVPPAAVPTHAPAGSAAWTDAVVSAVRDQVAVLGAGRMAVVAPHPLVAGLRTALGKALDDGDVRGVDDPADAAVTVSDVTGVKGLEFDAVVLCEPGAILDASPRGAGDLYVALTRPTQRLLVVSSGPLPAGMEELDRPIPRT
ncbi:DNA helicase IV [Quadrisphaera granulorum]|uniref:DNA helicase IV n=1 Tax=Quadrisphaera granulorum TaxID=317664 RepID=A0A316AFG6_9ACTN|nr:AAA family ATPase [Quadrisphaera granulorum]PWJ55720.1 DNA helicase IV [Quadrisphaera granulorum]SZE95217.1 DNA helicase IV [Quadrisphaera granulorum]